MGAVSVFNPASAALALKGPRLCQHASEVRFEDIVAITARPSASSRMKRIRPAMTFLSRCMSSSQRRQREPWVARAETSNRRSNVARSRCAELADSSPQRAHRTVSRRAPFRRPTASPCSHAPYPAPPRSRGRTYGRNSAARARRSRARRRRRSSALIAATLDGSRARARRVACASSAAMFASSHAKNAASRIAPYLITSASPARSSRVGQRRAGNRCRSARRAAARTRRSCSCRADG